MKVKIEGVGYLEAPDNTPPEQISAAVKRIAAKQGGSLEQRVMQRAEKGGGVLEGIKGAAARLTPVPMVGQAAAGLAGLARLIHTGSLAEADKTIKGISESFDKKILPQPETELGKKISDVPAQLFGAVANAPQYLQDYVAAPMQDAMFGPGASKAIAERKAKQPTKQALDAIAANLAPMAIGKKSPAPESPVTPIPEPIPKATIQKVAGKSVTAEQAAILDAFEPGKRKQPTLREGVKPTDVKKIIGLDIDNVLNRGAGKLDPDLVANLNKVLDSDPNAKIVVGSTWRMAHTPESFDEMLSSHGVRPGRVIGLTGDLENAPRGAEYAEWIKTHGKGVKNFVILDDRTDMQPFGEHHVQTKEGQGLTPGHADTTIQMLKGKQKNWQWAVGKEPLPVGPGAKTKGSVETPTDITQLQEALADIPRSSQAERMKAAAGIAGEGKTFSSKLSAGLERVKAGAAGLWDAYKREPIVSNFKEALGDYLYSRAVYQSETRAYAKDVLKTFPDKMKRAGIYNWFELKGDEGSIKARIAETKDPAIKAEYEAALNLSPEEKLYAKNVGNYFESMADQGLEAGLFDHAIDNYISRIVKDNQLSRNFRAEVNSGLLRINPKFAKQRVFEMIHEGEVKGIRYNKDFAEVLVHYDEAFKEAIAARSFIKSLFNGKARDGRPLAVVSGSGKTLPKDAAVPEAYLINPNSHPGLYKKDPTTGFRVRVDDTFDYRRPPEYAAFKKWKWVDKDPDGAPILVQGDVLLHPEIDASFAERFKGEGVYSMHNLFTPSAIKQNPIGRMAMKGLAEFKATLLNLSFFHQVQVGTHAVFHNVNPFKAPPIDLYDPLVARGIKNGLMTTDHSALGEFSEGLSSANGLVNRIPKLGPAMQRYQEYLFQDYIPRLKVTMFKEAFERNAKRYPQMNENQIAEMTAHQANAAFGELNYKWLGRNKTFQDGLRMLLLAPDFLEARTKFVAQALTPAGKEQLVALVRGTAELYAGARVMNAMLNDGDMKTDKPFSVVYNKKEYALRTIPGDLAHLFTDPRSFVYYRLNPGIVRPMVEWATGKDAQGKRREGGLEVFDFIKSGVPIPIQGFLKDPGDSVGEKFMTTALQSLGINSFVARTEAEAIAAKASAGNIPASNETFETRAQAKLMRALRKDVSEQATGMPKSVLSAMQEGKISQQQAINLILDRNKPPLQKSFEHLRLPQQLNDIDKIFEKATPEEKKILVPLMKDKTINFFTNVNVPKEVRDKYRERLMPYLQGVK